MLTELTTTAVSVSTQQQASGIKTPTPTVVLASATPTSTLIVRTSQHGKDSYLSSILSGVKIVDEPYQLVFLDFNDEVLWMIEDRYIGLAFDPSGCFLFSGWVHDQYAEVSKLTLKGQVLDTKSISYDENLETAGEVFGFLPSPTGDFLAYMVGSGEGGRGPADAEFLDVGLIDFRDNRSSKPAMLTSNGGGPFSGPVWSSDGQHLAFSDFDENGIVQILVYGIEEERTYQLSNFGAEMRNWEISDLIWSPDGTKVAFSAFRKKVEQNAEPGIGILGVGSNTDRSLLWVSPQSNSGYHSLYWEPDSLRLMALRKPLAEDQLIFFDAEIGEELEVLGPLLYETRDSERKEIIRRFILPIGMGYLYETEDGIFIPDQGDILLMINELILPTQGPIDLSKCPSD